VLAALGIERHQLIQPHCRLLLEAEELLVPSLPTPNCLRQFGELLVTRLGADATTTRSRRIYIARKNTGTRRVANEAELDRLLESHGFETHSMENYTLAKQARLIRESETIVAIHGAGLANLLFARPGTAVVEIVPAGRYNATIYPEKSRIFGLNHQLVFADRARHKQILYVSLADVEMALAQTQRVAYRSAAA
jgi:capsular polysaccharide biosynthesis protein